MGLAEEMISAKATTMELCFILRRFSNQYLYPSQHIAHFHVQTSPIKYLSELQVTSYIPSVEFDPAEMYSGETLRRINAKFKASHTPRC